MTIEEVVNSLPQVGHLSLDSQLIFLVHTKSTINGSLAAHHGGLTAAAGLAG